MLILSSELTNVAAVEPFVENATKNLNINKDRYGDILISLTEAVNNAIRHGNSCQPCKRVKVKLKKRKSNLTFSVSDEGNGFDYNNLPNPLEADNIFKTGGRGVFLMRTLSDGINFKNNGSTVEMRFKLH